jgi:DHA3 family macrolide efflux protein-like MFS transporter
MTTPSASQNTAPPTAAPLTMGPMLTMRQVLRDPSFARLWLAQLVSIFGDFVALFAVQVAVTFRMHGSPEDVTGIMVAYLAPAALIGPVAGVFVDRWNVRRTMIASDLTRGVLIVLLAFSTHLWQFYAVFFALSTVSTFFAPAQAVTVPLLVKREGLMAASGLMQQSMQLVRIFSPAVAAGLVGRFGEASCYYADSLTFFFSAAMLTTLTYHRPVGAAARGLKAVLGELRMGLKFIFTHPKYSFVIISMAAGMFAISCFGALLSVYIRDILHGTAYLLGTLGSLIGAGSIAGAIGVQRLARGRQPAYLVSGGLFGVGVFIAVLAASGNRVATLVSAAGIGISVAFIMVAASAMLQGETPIELRGRVSSSSMALIAISQGIAMVFAGGWATRYGIVNLFYASAVMLFVVALVGVWKLRRAS